MNRNNKFKRLTEAMYSRYGTFLFNPGNIVHIDKKMLNDEEFKKLPKQIKDMVEQMVKEENAGDASLIITNIQNPTLQLDSPVPSTITIAYSRGGGAYDTAVTLPGSLTEYMEAEYDYIERRRLFPPNVLKNAKEKMRNFEKRVVIDVDEMEKEMTSGYVKTNPVGVLYPMHKYDYEEMMNPRFDKKQKDDYSKRKVNTDIFLLSDE